MTTTNLVFPLPSFALLQQELALFASQTRGQLSEDDSPTLHRVFPVDDAIHPWIGSATVKEAILTNESWNNSAFIINSQKDESLGTGELSLVNSVVSD